MKKYTILLLLVSLAGCAIKPLNQIEHALSNGNLAKAEELIRAYDIDLVQICELMERYDLVLSDMLLEHYRDTGTITCYIPKGTPYRIVKENEMVFYLDAGGWPTIDEVHIGDNNMIIEIKKKYYYIQFEYGVLSELMRITEKDYEDNIISEKLFEYEVTRCKD